MAKRVAGHGYRLVSKEKGAVKGQCKCGEEFAGVTQSAAYALFLEHKEAAEVTKLISSKFPFKPVFGEGEFVGGKPPIVGWRAPKEGESGWETYMSA